jgi:pimeloyl-ACP methyl ester carboxylesterase
MAAMHVRESGDGPRVVLVHGSIVGGESTWGAQAPLAASFRLVVPDRPGFGETPADGDVDFERQAGPVAALLDGGAHLVGHSYGAVISLLAAALRPDAVRSLTVIEPPCFAVAAGDPAVDALVASLEALWRAGPRDDPEAFLHGFVERVGASVRFPSPLPAELEQGARVLMNERGPWEAEIPTAALREAPFPTLVVSGGHHPAFEAVCDALERELDALRATIPGAGHSVQRTGEPVNATLAAFLEKAA